MSHSRRVVLALACVYVVWGSTFLTMRIGLEGFPPLMLSGTRFTTVGLLLLGFLAARGTPLPNTRQWLAAAPVGVLLFVVANGFIALAQDRHIGSGVSAVVAATVPLWIGVMAAVTGERPRPLEWLGIAVGVGAVATLSTGADLRADLGATLLLLCSPVGWALGSLGARRAPAGPGGLLAVAGAQQLCGGATALLAALAHGERMTELPGARPLAAMAYMVVMGSLLTFPAYLWLLRNTRPVVATSYSFVNPIFAVLLGALLAAEPIHWQTLVATPMVVAAVALVLHAHDTD